MIQPEHERIAACLVRYKDWVSKQLSRTNWGNDLPRMNRDFNEREKWLSARRKYLEAEYEKARSRFTATVISPLAMEQIPDE